MDIDGMKVTGPSILAKRTLLGGMRCGDHAMAEKPDSDPSGLSSCFLILIPGTILIEWDTENIWKHMVVSINGGSPIAGWCRMENPILIDDWFRGTPISGNFHVSGFLDFIGRWHDGYSDIFRPTMQSHGWDMRQTLHGLTIVVGIFHVPYAPCIEYIPTFGTFKG